MSPVAPSDLRLLDFILMAILLAGLQLWDHFFGTPRMRRKLAAGTLNPVHTYVRTATLLWGLTLLLAIDWWMAGRDPQALDLVVHMDLRFIVGSVLTAAVVVLISWQSFRVLGYSAERKRKAIEKNARIFELMPTNPTQLLCFMGLSLTAGITEELLFRGFLIWCLSAFMSPWLAAVLSSVLFGLGHAYQGARGILKTGGVGLIMAILYVGSGTILLPMFLHAFVDAANGALLYSLKSNGIEKGSEPFSR